MKNKEYAGIDYGLGRSNIDTKTGIRHGVISLRSLDSFAIDDFYQDATDVAWDEAIAELEKEHGDNQDAFDDAKEALGNQWEVQAGNLLYEQDGYKLTGCLDNDLFVLASPYYTHAQFCSPCVPGAGNLNEPMFPGVKTFCLSHNWFEDGAAPYPVFSVDTGLPVESEHETHATP